MIIPLSLQELIKAELHREHLGISKMKTLARNHVWWSGIDQELESLAKSCQDCAAVKQSPAKAPLHPWSWPTKPWERIHIDFAGPFMNKSFLIVVDAYSKWADVIEMPQTTADKTITALRHVFSTHGIPAQIVSNNGPQFTSSDFAQFAKQNGIKHTRTSPYHPASDGEAERFVRTFKEAMKAGRRDGLPLSHRLANFLLSYRTTPHSTTGVPPCELIMGRHLHTRLDLLKPNVRETVCNHQMRQKNRHDRNVRIRSFESGQTVMVWNFWSGDDWITGVIIQRVGTLTYLVEVSGDRVWKRHVDHVKECHFNRETRSEEPLTDVDYGINISSPSNTTDSDSSDTVAPPDSSPDQVPDDSNAETPSIDSPPSPDATVASPEATVTPPCRYPSRSHQPPERFDARSW